MKIIIDKAWCKGCKLCISVCPKDVFVLGKNRSDRGYIMPEAAASERCINCKQCEYICPDFCITVEPDERQVD
jgi:2-oxoglutarate ferredoxin oxidoreductase subunit delta